MPENRKDHGRELMDQICSLLDEYGVNNFVVVFSDPDENSDRFQVRGSRFWRAGVGMDLVEEVKESGKKEALEDSDS